MAREVVARGRPLRGQTGLAPLAKRSTCSKSSIVTTICYERGGQSDHLQPKVWLRHTNTYWVTPAPRPSAYCFKILLYTFKALHGATPTYLTELISPYVARRALRSADQLLLKQPRHKLKLIGLRAFSVCAPYLWNSLPFEIKSSASVSIFKAKLKTYLFRQAYF